jgi:hypothetical protein
VAKRIFVGKILTGLTSFALRRFLGHHDATR